jgi:hypothetical protein
MARPFRESRAAMAGTVHGAILDELMNEVAVDPQTWPFTFPKNVRIACTPGHTFPMFVLLFTLSPGGTLCFLGVEVSEALGAWGTERTTGETYH